MQVDQPSTESGDSSSFHAPPRRSADSLDATEITRRLSNDGRRWRVRVVDTTGSTNTDLLNEVRAWPTGLPALLAARRQVAGRGRLGRTWQSGSSASLTVSFALSIGRRMAQLEGVTLVCGLAIGAVVSRLGVPARLKWPNDVLVDHRKLAGILVEAHALGEATALVVGVGLNLEPLPDPVFGISSTSLREAGVAAPDRNALVARMASALGDRLDAFERTGFAPFADAWRAVDAFAGRDVVVRVADEAPITGVHAGIDASGALLVDAQDGQRRFAGGDLSVRLA